MEKETEDATWWAGILDMSLIRYLLSIGEHLALIQVTLTANQGLRHSMRGGGGRRFTARRGRLAFGWGGCPGSGCGARPWDVGCVPSESESRGRQGGAAVIREAVGQTAGWSASSPRAIFGQGFKATKWGASWGCGGRVAGAAVPAEGSR